MALQGRERRNVAFILLGEGITGCLQAPGWAYGPTGEAHSFSQYGVTARTLESRVTEAQNGETKLQSHTRVVLELSFAQPHNSDT